MIDVHHRSILLTEPKSAQLGAGVVERVGNTPLLRLERVGRAYPGAGFYAKAEWFNPGGSVKDRPALNMIREGERSGALRPGKTILDATSGNTGIAYAMMGAALGYRVKLCLPANASRGAQAHPDGLWRRVGADVGGRGIGRRHPPRPRDLRFRRRTSIFYPDQYSNPANWQAHYETTAPEIWRQTEGRITHFVAGLGTSGTFVGTARRLKELNPAIQCISLQPDSAFHGLEGWKHMASAIVPQIYDPAVADRQDDRSNRGCLPHGQAPGARGRHAGQPQRGCGAGWLHAGGGVAAAGAERAVIVTIFADAAEKYLSERFWDEE